MADGTQKYDDQLKRLHQKAGEFKEAVIAPAFNDDGSMKPDFMSRLDKAKGNTIFDSAGEGVGGKHSGGRIMAYAAKAVAAHKQHYGSMPSDEVMAGIQNSVDNLYALRDGVGTGNYILDAASGDMSNSDGIIKRDHLAMLIAPVALTTVTNNIVTIIPAGYDKTEVSWINRKAGSDFGDFAKGDIIDVDMSGRFSNMTQIKVAAETATANQFSYDTSADFGGATPIRKERVQVYIDNTLVAEDNGNGLLVGQYQPATGGAIAISGTVDYNLGIINPIAGSALPAGLAVHVRFGVNIEKAPEKIPVIDHEMDSKLFFPHESALVASSTIAAAISFNREYNRSLNGMQLSSARNVMSAEKDRSRLDEMYYAVSHEYPIVYNKSAPQIEEAVRQVQEVLNIASNDMVQKTKITGITTLFGGRQVIAFLKSLPGFVMAPGYKQKPQPHYVGRLWGVYEVFEDGRVIKNPDGSFNDRSWKLLGIGKGQNYGDSGFIAGDAIAAVEYKHSVGRTLKNESTFYSLEYRDIHKRNGRAFFVDFLVSQV